MAYSRLPVREYPNIDEPVVSVTTDYTGASPEIIESQVTQPLEEVLSGIEGVDVMTSQSRAETQPDHRPLPASTATRLGRRRRARPGVARARQAARRGRRAGHRQGRGRRAADHLSGLSSDRHSPIEVTDYADRFVKDRLQNLPGVAEVRIFGERRYAMRIWLDRLRLAAYGLTPQDVEDGAARARTSRCRPAGSRASSASSPSWPKPICGRPSSSTIDHRATPAAIWCGSRTSAGREIARRSTSARSPVSMGKPAVAHGRRQAVDRQPARDVQGGAAAAAARSTPRCRRA